MRIEKSSLIGENKYRILVDDRMYYMYNNDIITNFPVFHIDGYNVCFNFRSLKQARFILNLLRNNIPF